MSRYGGEPTTALLSQACIKDFAVTMAPLLPHFRLRCCFSHLLLLVFSLLRHIISPSTRSPPDLRSPFAPGIGISLSHHSASIVIRSSDGTATKLAHVSAPPSYNSLLKRFSQHSARYPAPPYSSLSESCRDRPRQWRRAMRKRLGWPGSADAGIIAEVLQDCASVAKAHGAVTKTAVAVVPNVMALYAEDVQDAFEHIGWVALSEHNFYGVPRALRAAYAGYGSGLCQRLEDSGPVWRKREG